MIAKNKAKSAALPHRSLVTIKEETMMEPKSTNKPLKSPRSYTGCDKYFT